MEHVDCYFHLRNVVSSPYTSSDLLTEIIKGARFKDYYSFRDYLWSNPNIDAKLLDWLDIETANWPVDEAFQYWQTRASIKAGETTIPITPGNDIPTKSNFSEEFLNGISKNPECSLELLRICKPLAQQLWHDLAQEDIVYLQYQEDSVSGSTFRAYMPDNSMDVPERVLDALSYGYFTDWISKEAEIDESRVWGDVVSKIEEDGFKEWDDTVEESTLCKALIYGSELGDLEITGNLQKYLRDSGLFGESDFDYPVKIESEPAWDGPRFSELTVDQQLNLVNNICNSMPHSLFGRKKGIGVHLLVCIILHPATSPEVLSSLKGKTLGDEVAVALEYSESD